MPTETKPASARARRSRKKGQQVEREVVHALQAEGIEAEKLSRSGYTGPDILVAKKYLGESKMRATGWKTISGWLKKANVLFLREGGSRAIMVVLRLEDYAALLRASSGVMIQPSDDGLGG